MFLKQEKPEMDDFEKKALNGYKDVTKCFAYFFVSEHSKLFFFFRFEIKTFIF